MASGGPALSIVVCSRNGVERLPQLFSSLRRLPASPAWEVVVVDNASTDATKDVILREAEADGRIRYVFCDTLGLGSARNAGWRNARGSIIAFTDDDCLLAPDYVEKLLSVFEQRPNAGFVGGRVVMADRPDAAVINARVRPRDYRPYTAIAAGDISGANHAFRRGVLELTGGYDPLFGMGAAFPCEDVDAVAAASWAGVSGRFDPAPIVYHLGRCSDESRLVANYDRGRGAYYMKYVLRSDSRRHYLKHWVASLFESRSLSRFGRELAAAVSYAALRFSGR